MKTILLLLPLLLTSCADYLPNARALSVASILLLLVACFVALLFLGNRSGDCSAADIPAQKIGFGPREEMAIATQARKDAPCQVMDTEALAELMHDAYQTSGIVETRKIMLWQGIRNEPEKHAERNAWRAAARAVAKRLA